MEDKNILLEKTKEGDSLAEEQLMHAYKPKVIAIAREYFLVGADFDDLIQEGMIGLYKAINAYDKTKNHNFSAFASLCIHRQIQNAVKFANREKNRPLNSYLSIKTSDGSIKEQGEIRIVLADEDSNFEKNMLDKETNSVAIAKVKNLLTEQQFKLLNMFLNGQSYAQMADNLNLTTKQVDNALQTIKKKLKQVKGEM